MRNIERLVDIWRGRQAVGRGGRRQKVGRGRWLADAAGAGIGRAVIGQIQMDVVVVEDVRARRQDGREIPAGAGVRLMQERGLLAVRLLPVVDEINRSSVGEREAGDVDRVAEGMLGELGAFDIVDRPASCRRRTRQVDDPLAEPRLRDPARTISSSQASSAGIIEQSIVSGLSTLIAPSASAETLNGWVMPQMPGPLISGLGSI